MMIFSRGNLQLASEDSWHFACKSMIYNQKDKDSTSRRQFGLSWDQPRSLPSLETGCTFALFFTQQISLPVLILISQQSAWIQLNLISPVRVANAGEKVVFLLAAVRLLQKIFDRTCFRNVIWNNVNININYQEFLWRAVCHDSRLGFSWKGFVISFSK